MSALRDLRPDRAHKTNHRWSLDEREVVRCQYDSHHATTERIARSLGVSFNAVKAQARILGVMQRRQDRPWTYAEEERLRELVTQLPYAVIARRLKRTVIAVQVKAKRLGASPVYRDGWYTKMDVRQILGQDHKWVQRQIDSGALIASYHHGHKPSQNGSGAWHIQEKDLKRFIREHSMELTGRNVDLATIIAMFDAPR